MQLKNYLLSVDGSIAIVIGLFFSGTANNVHDVTGMGLLLTTLMQLVLTIGL